MKLYSEGKEHFPIIGRFDTSLFTASFAVIRHRINQQQSIVEFASENVGQFTKEIRHAA
jgi:hypothetical protein